MHSLDTQTVTRSENDNGTYRYVHNGREIYAASRVFYEFASLYVASDEHVIACFHKTHKAALRGNPDMRYCTRIPGVLEITEPDTDEYPACPVCGDPIDYCQGHGSF